MKKAMTINVIIILLCFTTSCNKSDDAVNASPMSTDISIASSQNVMVWIDSRDLTQKINNALSYSYGTAGINKTEKARVFNADTTQFTASIGFKSAFQGSYIDSNPSNNTVTIQLEKEIVISTPEGVSLIADGPGNTYSLITSVLAPGQNPIETPDCNHNAFGEHMDELFDSELNANVFRFYLHTTPDNDRCTNFDRQRNEIKAYDQSPDNLLGIEDEIVVYKWKFKLNDGFQSSPNFTHLHQLKSVGGAFESMPM